jgi:hypothetical protein
MAEPTWARAVLSTEDFKLIREAVLHYLKVIEDQPEFGEVLAPLPPARGAPWAAKARAPAPRTFLGKARRAINRTAGLFVRSWVCDLAQKRCLVTAKIQTRWLLSIRFQRNMPTIAGRAACRWDPR